MVLLGRWTARRSLRSWIQSISSNAPRRIALVIFSGMTVWKLISASFSGANDGAAPTGANGATRLATKASATSLWRTLSMLRMSTAFFSGLERLSSRRSSSVSGRPRAS